MANPRLAAIKRLAQEARQFAKEAKESPKMIHKIAEKIKKPVPVPKNNKTAISDLADEIMSTENVSREEALKIATREVQLAEKTKRVEKASNENQYFKKRDHDLDNRGGGTSTGPGNYPTLGRVTMNFKDGSKHMDYIGGMNKGHIDQEARWNWPHAENVEVQGVVKNPDYKKAAIMAAMGAGAATLGEDAEAAGLMTIAKKLKVPLEEAKRLKDLAPKVRAPDEENIRDIKKVSNFQRSRNADFEAGKYGRVPEGYKKLGSGVDYIAYETPDGDILKVPRDIQSTAHHGADAREVAPSLVHQVGLGPKTKTIRTTDKGYMIQEKMKPLDEMNPGKWATTDETMSSLYKEEESLINDYRQRIDSLKELSPAEANSQDKILTKQLMAEKQRIQGAMNQRQAELFKENGLDPEEMQKYFETLNPNEKRVALGQGVFNADDIKHDPRRIVQAKMYLDADKSLHPMIEADDLHMGNIGVMQNGKPGILDTSNFRDLNTKSIPEEMKQKVLQSYIGMPEQKAKLRNTLKNGSDYQENNVIPDDYFNMADSAKKAAGVAGAVGAGAATTLAPTEEAEASPIFKRQFFDKAINELIASGKLNRQELVKMLELSHKTQDFDKNLRKASEFNGHVILDRMGIDEDKLKPEELIQTLYPASQKLERIMVADRDTLNKNLQNDFTKQMGLNPSPIAQNNIGSLQSATWGNMFSRVEAPHSIMLNKDKIENPLQMASVGAHEGQHLDDQILFPDKNSIEAASFGIDGSGEIGSAYDVPVRISEMLNKSPEFKRDVLQRVIEANPGNEPLKVSIKKIIDNNSPIGAADARTLFQLDGFRHAYYGDTPVRQSLGADHAIDQVTGRHHVKYPGNFEIDHALAVLKDEKQLVPSAATADDLKSKFDAQRTSFLNKVEADKAKKKAAAGVPLAGGVSMGGELGAHNAPSDEPQQPQPSMFDKVMSKGKELGMYGLGKAVDAYDGLDQDTKYNIEAGMNVLSQPSAALKGGVLAAQKGEGLSGIYEGAKTAWNDPETAPTGVDIAEAMNIDDSNVLTKTGVSTAAEMLDPIDALGFGGAIKGARAAARLRAIGKLK